MSDETIKRYKRNYKRELMTYTFPEDYYTFIMNGEPKKNINVNERRNINVIKNTPKEFYLFEGKFIYYDILKRVNDRINEWIEIFNDKVRYMKDLNLIYITYMQILDYINKEISLFIDECKEKYNISYPIIADTLVKNYIDILMGRRLKIANNLRIILQSDFNLYYDEYGKEILDIYNHYQGKILSTPDEKIELYDEFKDEISIILNKPKSLERKKDGN